MSRESNVAIAFIRMGYTVRESNAKWQGSISACWEKYVQPYHLNLDAGPRATERRHEVYLMTVTFNGSKFMKVGISKNAATRFKGQRFAFPIADWELTNVAKTKNYSVARQCEMDMLVACVEYNAGGEWLVVDTARP